MSYLKTYLALLTLLAMTVGAVYIDMGSFNIFVTMSIAFLKAFLVMLFFMHVRYSSRLVWIYAALGFLWILILMGGTLADVLTRS